jgi:hypothetical protein
LLKVLAGFEASFWRCEERTCSRCRESSADCPAFLCLCPLAACRRDYWSRRVDCDAPLLVNHAFLYLAQAFRVSLTL